MTATIVTVYFVFSILLLVANRSYSDEVETYSIDPAYSYEDVSYQDYGYKSDEEKYSEHKEGRTKHVQQSTNSRFDKLLAARFNKINYDMRNMQKSQAQVSQKVIKLWEYHLRMNDFE